MNDLFTLVDSLPAGSSSPLAKEASSPFADELLCREAELAALEVFLQEHVCGRKAGSLYVSGPPGTGKSASINHLLESRPVSLCVCVGGGVVELTR